MDPGELIEQAEQIQHTLELSARARLLDQAAQLLSDPDPGWSANRIATWRCRVRAERAMDLARCEELEAARHLAEDTIAAVAIIDTDDPDLLKERDFARARAYEACGRALHFAAGEQSTRQAIPLLEQAIATYRVAGAPAAAMWAMYWRGAAYFNLGDWQQGVTAAAQALDLLDVSDPWRPTVASFVADQWLLLGRLDTAQALLDQHEGTELDAKSRGYLLWSQAEIASHRDDSFLTSRLIHEVERCEGEWLDLPGAATFHADAAECLDRVGERSAALVHLETAERLIPADPYVRHARAMFTARAGDPGEALRAIHALAECDWIERGSMWQLRLMQAWAALRSGDNRQAGALAAQAFSEAPSIEGHCAADDLEPALVSALLPVAEAAGSTWARGQLGKSGSVVTLRLIGPQRLSRDGVPIAMPSGLPGQLLRWLAVSPHGLRVGTVLEEFFPDVDEDRARHRLRQVLRRLRASFTAQVLRDGETLRLESVWTDVVRFQELAIRYRAARGTRRFEIGYALLALWGGDPLVDDPYAEWAGQVRHELVAQVQDVARFLATEATSRGSYDEALAVMNTVRDLQCRGQLI